MTARLILSGDASREKWLEARRQGVTASEIATVCGLSPWDSPYALYWRKKGELPEPDDNDAMALGRYLEDYVAQRFAELHPEFYTHGDGRSVFSHPDRPWQIATPDRIVYDHGIDLYGGRYGAGPALAVLECKTAASYDGWGDDGSDVIPVHYLCQVLWQMDVMGVQTGYVACLFLHSRKLRVYELTMDAAAYADLKIMRDTAQCFLDDLRDSNPPPVDWMPATTQALKHLHPDLEDREQVIPARMARAYRAACGRHKSAEMAKRRLENQIRERLGDARYATTRDGQRVARRDVYDLPEKTITRKASTVNKLIYIPPQGDT